MVRRFAVGPPVTLVETLHPVFDFLDQELPPQSRLLLLNTSEAFFLTHEFVADSFPQVSQIADALSTGSNSRRDHANTGLSAHYSHRAQWPYWGIRYPEALGEFLTDERRAKVVYWTQDSSVHHLSDRASLIGAALAFPPRLCHLWASNRIECEP